MAALPRFDLREASHQGYVASSATITRPANWAWLKRRGYRVVVHDYGAKPSNAPSLHEFEHLDDPAILQERADIKLAVICSPWPQYRSVRFAPGTKVLTP